VRLGGAAAALCLALTVACSGQAGSARRGTTLAASPVAAHHALRAELAAAACGLPHRELVRIWRGVDPGRSGQIAIVPHAPNFLGSNFPHSGPWDYLQDVPLLFYGPGIIPPLGRVERPVTIASIAPTEAKLLRFGGLRDTDGTALVEVPQPSEPPPLIVTLVWDAGGRSVLDTYRGDWPVLRSLIPRGIWYEHASVGSSPSITPATHATIGTGDFPMHTGQVDAEFRIGPELTRAGGLGPLLLMEPTLADLYDRAMGNRPIVGDLASVTWHLNMMSHGSLWGGGDRDIAVLRTPTDSAGNEGAEGTTWNLQGRDSPYYTFPAYVNDLPPLSAYTGAVDRADGALDGKWRDNDLEQLSNGFDTPARTPFQETLIETLIEREGFGADDVPDLLFLNYKAIDTVGHLFSADGIEMSDAVRQQDETLRDFVDFLNTTVGEGEWVMALTADHGTQEDPEVSGAFMIDINKLESGLIDRFDDDDGVPLVQKVRPTEIWVDRAELKDNGFTLVDVSEWFMSLTQEQTYKNRNLPQPGHGQDPVFSAALPSSILSSLPCLPRAARDAAAAS